MPEIDKRDLRRHYAPKTLSDRFALRLARALGRLADISFGRRYGGRALVLETIAAVPGMVAATLIHLKSLRRMVDDEGWVRVFMDEAENQRSHLMALVALHRPNSAERLLILVAQFLFYNACFLLYLVSPRTAHRLAGYLAEGAVSDYSRFLERIERGKLADAAAPRTAIDYWNLDPAARLGDVIAAMREDEAIHRDINHLFADALGAGRPLPSKPRPLR